MFLQRVKLIRSISTQISQPFMVTTPIFYVNAAPHIGHLYSSVIADAIFRFENLLQGHTKYIFTTGTDEHGSKIQQAAQKNKTSMQQYCDNVSGEYKKLFHNFNVDYTDFIRTTESRHHKAVEQFWLKLYGKGTIYKDKYAGWYCIPDETFLTESQLKEANGTKVSIESGHPVEWSEEINYVFRLSAYQEEVIRWADKEDRIGPKKFQKILLDSLQEPLPDVSVSRPTSRVNWGIRVPNDDSHSIYVWLDALVNYLTCSGYPNDEQFRRNWPPTVQVIGKDILKFHGIYWPAFLIAADIEPPQQLLVHSHWTVNDEKMSKSKMNVVDPNERSSIYTKDGMRYFLLREGVAHSDGNYSDIKVTRILNSELADTMGNLLSRACTKSVNTSQTFPTLDKCEYEKLLQVNVTQKLVNLVEALPEKCFNHYKSYNFYLVVDQVIEVLHSANKFFETTKPWELKKRNEIRQLEAVLAITMETLRICGIILQPIIPVICKALLDKLNVNENQRNWIDLSFVLWNQNENNVEIGLRDGEPVLFRRIQLDGNEKTNNKSTKKKDKKKTEIIS
ncbi:Methionine--tRNA ligase, mitochondrial [Pseudolycoriella hygida]|uniref:Methionine--tRNA ligase, mitochondrial n=1 Tax=Pseudolycoriella hygida TaxID=35572 RepID=A0A9Q0RVX8_9DIPT|nr:Methionine--tRNA ligase, mitochondrial [Pseudolycoriella hygida]